MIPGDADYLRVVSGDPVARQGVGSLRPDYIGAFPLGPAPREGDWLTRLRKLWPEASAQPAAQPAVVDKPIDIAEPPPLEEWLKGREVLTVAQDGSGQFRTIQAALDALQAGQVVKVLDRGPYRENLYAKDIPADTGLVSEQGTVLTAPEWKLFWKGQGGDEYLGQRFENLNGFRLSGFTLDFPAPIKESTHGVSVLDPDGIVLENCWIRKSLVNVSMNFHKQGAQKAACVRECRFDGSLQWLGDTTSQAKAVIARNHFVGGRPLEQLGFAPGRWSVAIRNNIFGSGNYSLRIGAPDLDSLEISNNLLDADAGVIFTQSIPRGAVTVCNNLRTKAGFVGLHDGAEQHLPEAVRLWQVGHNCLLRDLAQGAAGRKETVFPRSPTDILGAPRFLSKVPASEDYLRIAADDPRARSGVGGAWPDYIGPFPPARRRKTATGSHECGSAGRRQLRDSPRHRPSPRSRFPFPSLHRSSNG